MFLVDAKAFFPKQGPDPAIAIGLIFFSEKALKARVFGFRDFEGFGFVRREAAAFLSPRVDGLLGNAVLSSGSSDGVTRGFCFSFQWSEFHLS